MSTLHDALLSLRPGATWRMDGEDYAGLEWLDKVQKKPTAQEVTAEISRLTSLKEAEDQRQRDIKNDTGLKDFSAKLRSMSPNEFASYIDSNVTNLASAKTVIIRMGLMMMLLHHQRD